MFRISQISGQIVCTIEQAAIDKALKSAFLVFQVLKTLLVTFALAMKNELIFNDRVFTTRIAKPFKISLNFFF